jgi:hypothetical protein
MIEKAMGALALLTAGPGSRERGYVGQHLIVGEAAVESAVPR